MSHYFVADIGGTNARFGCVVNGHSFRQIEHARVFCNEDFTNIGELIHRYFMSIPECRINTGCLAIAGPVTADRVSITNLGWSFSTAELRKQLQLADLAVINDFVGLAHSLPHLSAADLLEIVQGKAKENATRIVLGPGTGLGVAALITGKGDQQTVISTEAGHIGFAPRSALEIAVLQAMRQRGDYIPIEDLVSGSALPVLYKVLARLEDKPETEMTATKITRCAAEQTDPVCIQAVSLFCSMLASFAGDMALCFNANGGVYLGGGLLPKLETSVITENFTQQFRHKGRMSHLLADIPVYLIKPGNTALIGASNYYQTVMPAPGLS